MAEKKKRWRPSILDESIIKKLEEAFKVGSSITQACTHAGISLQDFYNRMEKNKEFFDKMESARNFPYIFSKEAIFKAINSKDPNVSAKYALEFLKRRDPDRKDKQETTNLDYSFTWITIEDATKESESSKKNLVWRARVSY